MSSNRFEKHEMQNALGFHVLALLLLGSVCIFSQDSASDEEEEEMDKSLEKLVIDKPVIPDDECLTKGNILVVYQIPMVDEDENLIAIVEEIAAKLNISHPLDDVVKAYRSRVPVDDEPIVIHLASKEALKRWLAIYEKQQFHTLFKHGFHIMEGLPKGLHNLKDEVKRWVKKMDYHKAWSENNTVVYRKTKTGASYKVKDFEHLHYLHENEYQLEIEHAPAPRRAEHIIGQIFRRRFG